MKNFIEKYWWLIGLGIIALPLSPMINLGASFDGDWYIHLWFSRYFTYFIKENLSLPWEVNSFQFIGAPLGLFYSNILNPLLGFIGIFMGPQVGARILIVLSTYLEFFLVFKLFSTMTKDKIFSLAIAAIMCWAIYPYTVVFSEAAIPEFFATTMTICGFCAWFILLFSTTLKTKIKFGLIAALCLALSTGSHPITAFYSAFFIGIVSILSFFYLTKPGSKERKQTFFIGISILTFLAIFLSPWIYANLVFLGKLNIGANPSISFYPENIDAWWTRFQLFPFDKRSLLKGQLVNTAYLDAQINMALFIFIAVSVWSAKIWRVPLKKNILFITGVVLFLITSWMSVSLLPYKILPQIFQIVQFCIRLITYQNLSLLFILIALLTYKPKALTNTLVAVCLTIAFLNALERTTHSVASRNPESQAGYSQQWTPDKSFLSMTKGYDGIAWAYVTQKYPLIDKNKINTNQVLNFDVELSPQFGEVVPKKMELKSDSWTLTNVMAFPWNKIYVDGKLIESDKIKREGNFLVVLLNKGAYTVTTAFEVPLALRTLKTISLLSLFGVFLGLCFSFLCLKHRKA